MYHDSSSWNGLLWLASLSLGCTTLMALPPRTRFEAPRGDFLALPRASLAVLGKAVCSWGRWLFRQNLFKHSNWRGFDQLSNDVKSQIGSRILQECVEFLQWILWNTRTLNSNIWPLSRRWARCSVGPERIKDTSRLSEINRRVITCVVKRFFRP